MIFRFRRRLFLRRTLGLGAIALSGCDRLSRTAWFPPQLDRAETLNNFLQHALASRTSMAAEYSEADLSPRFPSNGTHNPNDAGYRRLAADSFRQWRLEVSGLVERPLQLSLADIKALPSHIQITRHDCVEGWSAIAKWTGPHLGTILDLAKPLPQGRYVVFFCADPMDMSGTKYYESIDFEDAYHPQTILAHTWNDQALPVPYGAPLRLRVERQLGYKMAKYIMRMRVVQSFSDIEGGKGGYWEDQGYEWFAGI